MIENRPNKSLAIDNSFTLRMTNTTNYAQNISLFGLGVYTQNIVQSAFTTGQTNNVANTFPNLPPAVWNSTLRQPYTYFGNPSIATLTSYPTIDDITIKGTGNIRLVSTNEIAPSVYSQIIVPVTNGESLQVVNDRLNQYIRDFADTTNFRNSQGEVMVVNLTIDFSVFYAQPLPITTAGFKAPFGISVQYPYPNDLEIGSTGNPIRLEEIFFPSYLPNSGFSKISFCPLSIVSSANGVEVKLISSTGNTIGFKNNQIGGVLRVDNLVVNVSKSLNQFYAQAQLLRPYGFRKINVNGNELQYIKAQTIDPQQYQNSFSNVNLREDGEVVILDGQTFFDYTIEPSTSVNITYNYVQLKISNYGTEESEAEILEDEKIISELDEQTKYAETKVLETNLPFSAESRTKNVYKKPKLLIPLLLGAVALILFSNSKTNQQ